MSLVLLIKMQLLWVRCVRFDWSQIAENSKREARARDRQRAQQGLGPLAEEIDYARECMIVAGKMQNLMPHGHAFSDRTLASNTAQSISCLV